MSVRTFDDVIDRLDAIIKAAEDEGDRIGYFAALYRKFTMGVRDAARSGEFLDGGRMERFDVTFARRYFEALEAYRAGRELTRTWELSFEACKEERPSILQHLYAGLAAHQLLDLGVAAAEVAPGPRIADLREDFEHINQIVSRLTREVDAVIGSLSPWIGRIERFAGPQYAAFNKLGIAFARDLAWRVALDLAPVHPNARAPRIARVDARSAVIADNLLHPPFALKLLARAVRQSEPDDPREIIRRLRGAETTPVRAPKPNRRRKNRKRVAVLGGGVGGLTAAHELARRGFAVDVYEASDVVGGKACSQFLAGTGTGVRKDLPGEHGFRFFPSFYRHVIDTMRDIPVGGGGSVADRLRESTEMAMAERHAGYKFLRHPPRDIGDFFDVTSTIRQFFANTDIPQADVARFAQKMLGYMLACNERRLAIHEKQSFYEFLEGDSYSPVFRKYIATTRFMVAMDPKKASARTVATKGIQILTDFFRNGTHTDAALDGPTSERWIAPWQAHLANDLGVKLHLKQPIRELMLNGMRLSGVRLASGETVKADYYVLALPLDRAAPLVTDALAKADPALAALRGIGDATSWMVGAQFFLRERFPVCHGHVAYPDSEWSLSSVSQGQFWTEGLDRYGDGTVKDILSVDVSNWDEPSRRTGKTAKQAKSRDEVLDEVWAQLKDSLAIDDAILVRRHLDENVTFGPNGAANRTPLLVHPPGTWFDRPPADLSIENLFLASDYVKTNTDLASMEGANEAARRAVNAILDTEGLSEPGCTIWSMEEETGPLVALARRLDRDVFLLESNAGPAIAPRFGGVMADVRERQVDTIDRIQQVTDDLRSALRASNVG